MGTRLGICTYIHVHPLNWQRNWKTLLNVFIEYPDTINTLLTIRSNNQQLYIYILSYSIDKIHLHCCILKTRLYIVGQLTILYKIWQLIGNSSSLDYFTLQIITLWVELIIMSYLHYYLLCFVYRIWCCF